MKTAILRRGLALFLAFCLAFGCAGCRGGDATTMFLRKIEGTVEVSDAEEQSVEATENLGLYSGYGVGTQAESFAWIDLDKVKLAKLDENSEAAITKEEKKLSIEVKTGSLFFNVTKPLEDDETMDIRSSSMTVGIRGTCGWVEAPESGTMRVYILEGSVECAVGGNTATVQAGEMATMTADGKIVVESFTASAVPAYVVKEVEADKALNDAVLKASGINVAAYSLAAYEEFLSTKDNVVYSEIIDFEADGSPELLVFTEAEEKEYSLQMAIYRSNPEDPEEPEYLKGDSVLKSNPTGGSYADITWSLVEAADGRQYIRVYKDEQTVGEGKESGTVFNTCIERYIGSVAAQDGGREDWGTVDWLYSGSLFSDSGEETWVMPHDERGFVDEERISDTLGETDPDPALAEAVQSKYTLVRELFTESGFPQ